MQHATNSTVSKLLKLREFNTRIFQNTFVISTRGKYCQ